MASTYEEHQRLEEYRRIALESALASAAAGRAILTPEQKALCEGRIADAKRFVHPAPGGFTAGILRTFFERREDAEAWLLRGSCVQEQMALAESAKLEEALRERDTLRELAQEGRALREAKQKRLAHYAARREEAAKISAELGPDAVPSKENLRAYLRMVMGERSDIEQISDELAVDESILHEVSAACDETGCDPGTEMHAHVRSLYARGKGLAAMLEEGIAIVRHLNGELAREREAHGALRARVEAQQVRYRRGAEVCRNRLARLEAEGATKESLAELQRTQRSYEFRAASFGAMLSGTSVDVRQELASARTPEQWETLRTEADAVVAAADQAAQDARDWYTAVVRAATHSRLADQKDGGR